MGLAVSVGVLSGMDDEEGREYYRSAFELVNRALAAEGCRCITSRSRCRSCRIAGT